MACTSGYSLGLRDRCERKKRRWSLIVWTAAECSDCMCRERNAIDEDCSRRSSVASQKCLIRTRSKDCGLSDAVTLLPEGVYRQASRTCRPAQLSRPATMYDYFILSTTMSLLLTGVVAPRMAATCSAETSFASIGELPQDVRIYVTTSAICWSDMST